MTFDLNHNEDQRQILDAAATMLDAHYPIARLRNNAKDDLSSIAAFGAFSSRPSDSSFTLVDEALLHVLFGRHLVSTTVLAHTLGARLAAQLGRDDAAERAAAGAIRLCVATALNDSYLAVDGDAADMAVVFDGGRLILLDLREAESIAVEGLGDSIALTRKHAAPAAIVGSSTDTALLVAADLLISAHLLGVAEATRDLAVAYVQVRRQFGRPIGVYQAVKHHCANMAVAAEMLSAQLDVAAIAARDGGDDAMFQVAALRRLASKTALANARTCIQLHGGIGFSAEADAHHYLKRAHVLRQLGSGAAMLDPPAPLAPFTQPHRT